ncbi:DUF943 family protein [Pantoea sp.]|uniref:DUF943 family protein n=1 Tax=Pantoea sp. TaxID=69393 RepID=UPI0028B0083B|nr:DUF943 family protein [Pantoea sp.]
MPGNCIEKDKVFTVSYGRNLGLSFTTDDATYRMKENGAIVKDQSGQAYLTSRKQQHPAILQQQQP